MISKEEVYAYHNTYTLYLPEIMRKECLVVLDMYWYQVDTP